jgi:heme exporter protein CcmD
MTATITAFAAVLAVTNAWTYVAFAYGLTFALVAGYAGWVLARARRIARQLPPEERSWT